MVKFLVSPFKVQAGRGRFEFYALLEALQDNDMHLAKACSGPHVNLKLLGKETISLLRTFHLKAMDYELIFQNPSEELSLRLRELGDNRINLHMRIDLESRELQTFGDNVMKCIVHD